MKNYKKISIINGPFKQDILFPIDELGYEAFNQYINEVNKLMERMPRLPLFSVSVKVKDVSYKKIPKGFNLVSEENLAH